MSGTRVPWVVSVGGRRLDQSVIVFDDADTGTRVRVFLATGTPKVSVSDHDGHWCRLDGFARRCSRGRFLRFLASLKAEEAPPS